MVANFPCNSQLQTEALTCCIALAGERVIVVSHGATIEEICRHADPTSSARRGIPNTSISVIHISADSRHWILEKVGDAAHLNVNKDGFLQSAFGGDGASA
jgi:2,3-bisphosphoglycerate-dependent phosphoglycerate mutase